MSGWVNLWYSCTFTQCDSTCLFYVQISLSDLLFFLLLGFYLVMSSCFCCPVHCPLSGTLWATQQFVRHLMDRNRRLNLHWEGTYTHGQGDEWSAAGVAAPEAPPAEQVKTRTWTDSNLMYPLVHLLCPTVPGSRRRPSRLSSFMSSRSLWQTVHPTLNYPSSSPSFLLLTFIT